MEPDANDLERLRVLLRQMLGHDEPEPEHGNHVPNEGGNPTPKLTDRDYAQNFIRRLTGEIPAYSPELPEKDQP
jgi:hypothetical protein